MRRVREAATEMPVTIARTFQMPSVFRVLTVTCR